MKEKLLPYFLGLFALITVTAGCKKDNLIENGLLSDESGSVINVTDSVTIESEILGSEALRSDEVSIGLLGTLDEPITGKTKASILTQFLLSSFFQTQLADPANPAIKLDSTVLSLSVGNLYWKKTTSMGLKVYQLKDTINKASKYYTNIKDSTYVDFSAIVGEGQVLINPDSIKPVKLKLSESFSKSIFNAPAGTFADNDKFLSFFKGLYITADDPTATDAGNIIYLSMLGADTKITFYYTENDTTEKTFNLSVLNASERINKISHTYGNSAAGQELSGATEGNFAIAEDMGGVRTRLRFPYQKYLQGKNIAISKAQIIFTEDSSYIGPAFAPKATTLFLAWESEGKLKNLDDQIKEANIGGEWKDGQYVFNVTRHVQQFLGGSINDLNLILLTYDPLKQEPFGSVQKAERAILKGGKKIKLKLYISNI